SNSPCFKYARSKIPPSFPLPKTASFLSVNFSAMVQALLTTSSRCVNIGTSGIRFACRNSRGRGSYLFIGYALLGAAKGDRGCRTLVGFKGAGFDFHAGISDAEHRRNSGLNCGATP